MRHPLLNDKSKHYNQKGTSAIKELEDKISVAEMAGFCYGNIFKYEYRAEHKGQKEADLEKIRTYKAYFDVIKKLLHKGYKSHVVSFALKCEEIEYEYQ